MAVEWTDSADKHGIDRDDALYAMTHYSFYRAEHDEPRVPGARRPDLYVGRPGVWEDR